jgi:hypothetical protein
MEGQGSPTGRWVRHKILETQPVRFLEVGLSIHSELHTLTSLEDAADLAAKPALLKLVGRGLDLIADLGDISSFSDFTMCASGTEIGAPSSRVRAILRRSLRSVSSRRTAFGPNAITARLALTIAI